MEPLDLSLKIVLLGLSAILLAISLLAVRRPDGKKMIWIFASFLGFAVLSSLALLGEVTGDATWDLDNLVVLLLILIIGANYLVVLKG
ncbi:hypothetical protein DSECCO2_565990 [anaerobic digester metagenome]